MQQFPDVVVVADSATAYARISDRPLTSMVAPSIHRPSSDINVATKTA